MGRTESAASLDRDGMNWHNQETYGEVSFKV